MSSKEVVKAEVVKEIKLTSEDKKIAKKIKSKLRKTAETIIEIGEELIKAIEEKPRGFKEVFYKEIGISDRSAQRYMQIANHPKIIDLKENELEGKTMSDLLKLISPDTSMKSEKIDEVIFNPPRKGIDEKVLNVLKENRVPSLVYISCNPSTFARDAKILDDLGYKLEKIASVDMFSQTHHIEVVAKFVDKK